MCFTHLANYISDELLPGLPNSLVLGNLLHRIPWYSRPVLRAVSKSWHASITAFAADTPSSATHIPGLLLTHQLNEFNEAERTNYNRHKSFKFTVNSHFEAPHALSMYEEDTKQWRLLPPIQCLAPLRILHECGVASAGGKVYVMGGYDIPKRMVREDVFVLDIGHGGWAWERCKPMRFARYGFQCRAHNGKIYVVGGWSRKGGEPDPEAYDIERDEWEVLPRVLRQDKIEWAMAKYRGLAVVEGSLVTHGYWESQTGNVIRFHRRYDERERRWRGLHRESVCESVYWCMQVLEMGGVQAINLAGGEEEAYIDSRNIIDVVNMGSGAASLAFASAISYIFLSCAHSLAVSSHNRVVYTTLCHPCYHHLLSLWQGHIDHSHMHATWSKIALPAGGLLYDDLICSRYMCAFQP